MELNMSQIDRIIRVILAIAAIFLGWFISPWFYIITVVFGLTGIIGFCPIYKLFGLSTIRASKSSEPTS